MKILSYLSIIIFALFLIYAAYGLPYRGDTDALLNQELSLIKSPIASSYYIKNAMKDDNTPNMVTAVLGDYRSFDTLGEEVVIFIAGIICFLLLRKEKKREARK